MNPPAERDRCSQFYGETRSIGGEGEIRTHEPREGLPVFKTGAIDRSATSPPREPGARDASKIALGRPGNVALISATAGLACLLRRRQYRWVPPVKSLMPNESAAAHPTPLPLRTSALRRRRPSRFVRNI